ncbi:MAG: hypothetical protein H6Q10_504 [Acidobacteria bacterium]|nr:hypothetical protein [Acidobacteriota bacterium]
MTADAPGASPSAKAEIIADKPANAIAGAGVAGALAAAALVAGLVAVAFYAEAGLTLSHYDAKAHLVVARRVLDSLTPGWKQIGAVWLPLPHLLNLLPVQIDFFYRTGASAVTISVLSFALAAWACARLVLHATGSRAGAILAGVIVVSNPNMLYLQATPMTEALLLGLTTLAVLLVSLWVDDPVPARRRAAGAAIVLACLTRYEAWPVTAAALGLAFAAFLRKGEGVRDSLRRVAMLAVYPVLTVLGFLVQSQLTIGEWFVTGGFFVPDNPDLGRPFKAIGSVWWGARALDGTAVMVLGTAGAVAVLAAALWRRQRASALVLLALFATAALPWYAFFNGHPFRIRYMVALLPALAVSAGAAIGLLRRGAWAVAAVALGLVALQVRPFDARAPMVLEAQFDRPNSFDRRKVTAYLVEHRRGEKILVSFGSLSHYVQELSLAGLGVRDFIHEGNDVIWNAALEHPFAHAGWILVEERAEGGDELAARAASTPSFLAHFDRVAEGGGVALYRREAMSRSPAPRTGTAERPTR